MTIVKSNKLVTGDPLGRLNRVGRNGLPGLTFAVPVDGSIVSKRAFDYVASLMRPHDVLFCVYVLNSERELPPEQTASYTGECAKIQACVPQTRCELVTIDDSRGNIADDLVGFCEKQARGCTHRVVGMVCMWNGAHVHTQYVRVGASSSCIVRRSAWYSRPPVFQRSSLHGCLLSSRLSSLLTVVFSHSLGRRRSISWLWAQSSSPKSRRSTSWAPCARPSPG